MQTGTKLAEYVCEDERPSAKSSSAKVERMAWRSDGQQLAIGLQNRVVMIVNTAGLADGMKKKKDPALVGAANGGEVKAQQ